MANNEDDYFAREEIEAKRKLALKQGEALEAQEREQLKQLHFMKCPKCGMDLQTLSKGTVEVDTCFNCHGVWLDSGELETLVKSGDGNGGEWTRSVLNLFGRK